MYLTIITILLFLRNYSDNRTDSILLGILSFLVLTQLEIEKLENHHYYTNMQ